jgi:murein DD-endopeptidase MepM/ murein hydrolase activator NlpD
MERYNLPSGGIEVTITQDHKITSHTPYLAPIDKHLAHSRLIQLINASPAHHPIRYFITRSLMAGLVLATLGNVPVYSRLHLDTPTSLSTQIGSALQEEQTLAQLDAEDRQAESDAERLLDAELEQYQYNTTTGTGEVVMPSPQDSPTALVNAPSTPPPPTLNTTPKPAEYGRWSQVTLEETQSLADFLKANKFDHILPNLTKNQTIADNLKVLKAGRNLFIRSKGNELNQLVYAQDNNKAFVLTRVGNEYQGDWDITNYIEQETEVSFEINQSLSKSAHDTGVPSSVTKQLIQIFKDDINFQEFKSGDRIALIFEDYRFKDKSIYSKNLLAAEVHHKDQVLQRVRFSTQDGNARYLKPNSGMDQLQKVAFNRRPIQGGRMSSGFGFRSHPILGKWRLHKGTDFAAPYGTPIYATSDGTVKFIGRQSGYGKVIELSHEGNITTLYGHMSAFKQGLEAGGTVQRGQVIGYVGSTGRSTGNHVHYEFRQNNEALNPLTVALPKTGLFTPEERIAFSRYASRLVKRLANLQLNNDTATNNLNLTQQANDG